MLNDVDVAVALSVPRRVLLAVSYTEANTVAVENTVFLEVFVALVVLVTRVVSGPVILLVS